MKFSLLYDEPVTGPEGDSLATGRAAREPAGLPHGSRASTPFTLAVDAGWTAERILGTRPVDPLISDMARGTDREAGFTDLASRRALALRRARGVLLRAGHARPRTEVP
ncbi:hypothetical protein [Streptomyces lacrimifluminis]|nr:hypothetical protein [Streptomyces lacrimifluminis]